MKKKEKKVKKSVEGNECILREQTSMRVVLNGGKYRLDDATIPFQIGFNKEIADKQPTHILVMDVTRNAFGSDGERKDDDSQAERSLFKIQPVHYLQLKSPGVHHLIFILLKDVDSNYRQHLLEKRPGTYENDLYFSSIENNCLKGELGYFEAIVSIPKEFFATAPETKLQKAVWSWINKWYRLKPVDQCEYRKRKIIAFTVKPPVWTLVFIFRLICSVLLTSFSFICRVTSFIFGRQPVSFFPNMKEVWVTFLFRNNKYYRDIFSGDYWFGDALTKNNMEHSDVINSADFYPFKTLVLFGKKIHIPISLAGLITYPILFFVYYIGIVYGYFGPEHYSVWKDLGLLVGILVISFWIAANIETTIPTITGNENWAAKWNEYTTRGKKNLKWLSGGTFSLLAIVAVTSFMIVVVPWSSIINDIVTIAITIGAILVLTIIVKVAIKVLTPVFQKLKNKEKTETRERDDIMKNRKQLWLEKSFDIDNMPKKIDFNTMPEPSVASHKLVLTFWKTKARVCKPYAKS
jgi:hypothetical protein